jgi:protein TonB
MVIYLPCVSYALRYWKTSKSMNSIIVSSTTLVLGFVTIAATGLSIIWYVRWLLRKRAQQPIPISTSPITERNKYPSVNPFRWSSTFFMVALVLSLSAVVMAFNWTQFEDQGNYTDDLSFEMDEIQVQPPRTIDPPPPPPPPPPPTEIEEVLDDLEEEDISFEDQLVEEDTEVVTAPPPAQKEVVSPPVPPPPPKVEVDGFIFVAEQMPRFPGCENKKKFSQKEKDQCALGELLGFLSKNLKYPAIARENGIQGTCPVQFTVLEDGTIEDIELLRDIGGGCGTEAVRVMNLMNEKGIVWTPGKQRGKPVKVRMTLPIKFKLQ